MCYRFESVLPALFTSIATVPSVVFLSIIMVIISFIFLHSFGRGDIWTMNIVTYLFVVLFV